MDKDKSGSGRRRKLESNSTESRRPSRPSRVRGLSRVFGPAGRWLNQPVAGLPAPASSHPLVTALSQPRSLAPRYLRQSWAEMRQVTWPRFGQAMHLTFAVVIFSIVFAVLVANIDWLLTKIFEEIILNESQNIREFLRGLF